MTTTLNTEISSTGVNQAISAILGVLGRPETPLHCEALEAFLGGQHQIVKRLAVRNLSDHYCKSLAYLGGALKLTPNTDTILAESARAAAEFAKEKTLAHLETQIAQALD